MKNNSVQETAEKVVKSNLHSIQDNVTHWIDEAKPYVEGAIKKSKEAYVKAVEKLPENSNKIIAFTAAGMAIGLLGYQIGKSQKKELPNPIQKASEAVQEKAPVPSALNAQNLSHIFKFVKLWMFYKLSA